MIRKYISISIILIVVLSIMIYHYNEYLSSFKKPPSNEWSREIKYGSKKFNFPTYMFSNDKKIYAILPENNYLNLVNINNPDRIKNVLIKIDNLRESRVKNIQVSNNIIYFISDNKLMSIDLNGKNLKNYNITVNGFKIVDDKIFTFDDNGLYVYKIDKYDINLINKYDQIKNINEIDAKVINNEYYISLLSGKNYDRDIYLTIYDGLKFSKSNLILNYTLTSYSNLNNVRIGYDGGLYIFYLVSSKNDSKLFYYYYKNCNISDQKYKNVIIPLKDVNNIDNINSYDIIDDNNEVSLVASGDTLLKYFGNPSKESTEIIFTKWKNGAIFKSLLSTRTGTWASQPTIIKSIDGYYLSWIETSGFNEFGTYASSTSGTYKKVLNNVRPIDKQYAISTSIQRNAGAILLGLIYIIAVSLPAYVWFVIILLFEPKKFRDEAMISFYIGLGIYAISKFIFFPPSSIKLNIVNTSFPYNFKLMPLIFTIVSFLLTKLYFGKGKFNSNFAAFTFMLVTDMILTNIFYAPFLLK